MKSTLHNGAYLFTLPTKSPENTCYYVLNMINDYQYLRKRDCTIAYTRLDLNTIGVQGKKKIIAGVKSVNYGKDKEVTFFLVLEETNNPEIVQMYIVRKIEEDNQQKYISNDFITYHMPNKMTLLDNQYIGILSAQESKNGVLVSPFFKDSNTIGSNDCLVYTYDGLNDPSFVPQKLNINLSYRCSAFDFSLDKNRMISSGQNFIAINPVTYSSTSPYITIGVAEKEFKINTNLYGNVTAIIQLSTTTIVGCEKGLLKIVSTGVTNDPFEMVVAFPDIGIGNSQAYMLTLNQLLCVSENGIFLVPTPLLEKATSIYVQNIDWNASALRIKSCDPMAKFFINDSIRVFHHNATFAQTIEVTSQLKEEITASKLPIILAADDENLSTFFNLQTYNNRISFVLNTATLGTYFIQRKHIVLESARITNAMPSSYLNKWYGTNGLYNQYEYLNTEYYDIIAPPKAQITPSSYRLVTDVGETCYSIDKGKHDIFYDEDNNFERQQYEFTIIIISPAIDDIEYGATLAASFAFRFRNVDGKTSDSNTKLLVCAGNISGLRPLVIYDTLMNVNTCIYQITRPAINTYSAKMNKFGQVVGLLIAAKSTSFDLFYGISVYDAKSTNTQNSSQTS
ncbi:MAG: hypothetical protein ACRCXT_00490 [Paraclostridium sp.]